MIEGRRSLRFALKAAAGRGIGKLIGEQLHRNATIKLGVERLVYDTHSTFTKLTLNFVRADFQVRRGHGGPIVADSARFSSSCESIPQLLNLRDCRWRHDDAVAGVSIDSYCSNVECG